jgi:hypothetical protein
MSDELAQDEDDAAEYDLETMGGHQRLNQDDDEDDDATLVNHNRRGLRSVPGDEVVFEIGDAEAQESDDEDHRKTGRFR